VIPDWQTAAADLLVMLGRRWPGPVMQSLLSQFTPGQVPHYFTIKTMGDLATANGMNVVPLLKEVLARVIPVLGSIKHDNMKWVFASGMARFAEAILLYMQNFEVAPDKSITLETFSSEMYPPYEVMFSNWTKSSEKKVRLATMQAMGHMCAIMAKDVFESQVPKIVPFVLQTYKKEGPLDHLPITQAFVSILEAGTRAGTQILEPFLIQIFPTLHGLLLRPADMGDSGSMKNYNEMLRCFELIARGYVDQTITFLLRSFESKDPRAREVTVEIFKHFVNRLGKFMEDKKELVVSGLQPVIQTETNYNTRKSLSQLIIAMASHDYLRLEGGENLVGFIIRQSSISDEEIDNWNKQQQGAKNKADPGTSPSEVRSICDHILNLMATTVKDTHNVLWPYLLEFVTKPDSFAALAGLAKSIAVLGKAKRDSGDHDFLIDFDRKVNLPKPPQIFARFAVVLSQPSRRGEVGKSVLEALDAIASVLHPAVSEMWAKTIPRILGFLDSNKDSWNQTTWEDLVLRLTSETLKVVNEEEWTMKVADALVEQFALYKKDPELKKSAYKQLGIVLQQVAHKDFVKNRLEQLFNDVNHGNEHERQGCAQAFGYCANTHLDLTLERLVNSGGAAPKKEEEKSGGFFSNLFGGSKSESGAGKETSASGTIVLAYGYVAAFAKPNVITSRVESQILKNLQPFFQTKSVGLRETVIKTIDLIGKAMHPSHLKMRFDLKQRDELIKVLISYLANDPKSKSPLVTDQIRVLAVNCCTTLLALEPAIPSDVEASLLETTVAFYSLTPSGEDGGKTIDLIHDNFNRMLAAVLFRDPCVLRLRSLFGRLSPFVSSSSQDQRKRATTTILFLLKKLVEFVTESEEHRDNRFDNLGDTMAVFLPRATDPDAATRQMAIEAVQIMLYLDHILRLRAEKKDASLDPPSSLAPFTDFRKRVVAADSNEQYAIVHEMSALLSDVVPMVETVALMTGLVRGLTDSSPQAARGTCVLLYGLVSKRGSELSGDVARLVRDMCTQMGGIVADSTLNGTLHALKQLAVTHLAVVVDELLAREVPHPPYLVKSFQVLGSDKALQLPILHHLTNALNKEEVIETRITNKERKTTAQFATARSIAATVALGEVFLKEELKDFAITHYSLMFSTFVLRFGSSAGFADATEHTLTAFKSFLACAKDEATLTRLEEAGLWEKLRSEGSYLDALSAVTSAVAKNRPELLVSVYNFLLPYLRSSFVGQKLASATVLGELINYSKDDNSLLSNLVNAMLNSMIDQTMKIQALSGLSNVASCTSQQLDSYATTVLDALLSHVEDANESVSMSALNGLRKVMSRIEEARIAPIMINLCHRMRPLLDRPSAGIRAASVGMIGALARFGGGPSSAQFTEQCHAMLPTFLLHFNDDDESVKVAFKMAMKQISPFLGSPEVDKLFNGPNFDPNRRLNFDEFCNYVSKLLITSFPDRLNSYVMTCVDPYFKSQWFTVKASAASLVGALLGNISKEMRTSGKVSLNPSPVSKALILLLREPNASVRTKAALAMAALHSY
jgi:maestro heat-like repeat-containing protein family member 1